MEPLTFGYNEAWENRKCYWICETLMIPFSYCLIRLIMALLFYSWYKFEWLEQFVTCICIFAACLGAREETKWEREPERTWEGRPVWQCYTGNWNLPDHVKLCIRCSRFFPFFGQGCLRVSSTSLSQRRYSFHPFVFGQPVRVNLSCLWPFCQQS